MYTQFKVVYYEDIGKYFVHKKKPFGLWIQCSKPYKTKRQACIRMNMLALCCDYKTAIRIYNEDIGGITNKEKEYIVNDILAVKEALESEE